MMYDCPKHKVDEFIDDYIKYCADEARKAELSAEDSKKLLRPIDYTPFYDALEKQAEKLAYWQADAWCLRIAKHKNSLSQLPKGALPELRGTNGL